MRTIGKDERVASRMSRERGDSPPILTSEEKLHPVTIELLRELKTDKGNITAITVDIPTVDDILDQQMQIEPNKQTTLNSLAKVCQELTASQIKELHPRDFRVLGEVYSSFSE